MNDAPDRPRIPREIAASEDLTGAAEGGGRAAGYAGLPEYAPVLERLARVLHRGGRRHAVLTAEPGVDAEMFLADFAGLASSGWMPFLADKQVIAVDARHTTPEESRDRLLAILASVAAHPDAVICLSGFETLLRSPQGTNRGPLLCALDSIRCRLIGLMRPDAYEELIAGDTELEEVFARVELPEPSPDAAPQIVKNYCRTLAAHFQVKIADETAALAAGLSSNYLLHERLPGKARKVLHQVCQDIDFERTQLGAGRSEVTADDVFTAVSQRSGVPEETLRGIAEKRDYQRSLREFIVGQDHAVKEIATELGLIKAGLVDDGKPASVMMFVGRTGTGKTEMAKALARFYSNTKRLRTYTPGNMVEPHSVSSIIGVPPGYVGHDRGGKIVQDLNSDPHCVFLLDEADKAHPDVLQPFLNLFDEGWVRDQRGVQAYANKAIFILTTNVGQRMIADMARQGKTPEEMAARMKETLAQIKHAKLNRPVFAPEFLARIKRVIVFQPLSHAAMHGICRKLLREMQQHWLARRDKQLAVDELLVESIGEEAHARNEKSDGKEGGRIVRKLPAEYLEAPVQAAVSDRPAAYTAAVRVRVTAEQPALPPNDPPSADGQPNGDEESAESESFIPPAKLEVRVEFDPTPE